MSQDLQEDNKPKVRSITVSRIDFLIDDIDSNELEAVERKTGYTLFDQSGNTVEDITWDGDGEILERTVNVYDDSGILAESMLYEGVDELVERTVFEYTSEGKINKEEKHFLDGSVEVTVYHYSDKSLVKQILDEENEEEGKEYFEYQGDKLYKHEVYDEDGKVTESRLYQYSEAGNLVEEHVYENMLTFVNRYQYDDNGKVAVIERINDRNYLVFRQEFKRNEAGRIESIVEDGLEKKAVTRSEYDSNGNNTVQAEYSLSGDLNHRIVRKFDNYGNVLESEVVMDGQGRFPSQHYIVRYEYEFF